MGLLLCLDPGETLGWAKWRDGELESAGQFKVESPGQIAAFIQGAKPDLIITENYRVYAHRAKQHVGSEVLTVQYIGAIKLIAEMSGIPMLLQMAWQAKGFSTDAKLKQWGLYQVASPHANDAIRHGCYWYLFGKPGSKRP